MNMPNLVHKLLILLTPFIAATIAQIIKISIKQKGQRLKIRDFLVFTYSGMPSGHTALMVSLAMIIGLTQGFHSPLFAVCFVLMIVIINDALRLRNYLGQHGEILNILVKELKNDELLEKRYPHLSENIGHTMNQVLAGAILGVLTSTVIYWLFW